MYKCLITRCPHCQRKLEIVDDLIGKQIVVVANLKPAKIMAILSNGMMLAAIDKKRLAVVTLDDSVPPGTPLS